MESINKKFKELWYCKSNSKELEGVAVLYEKAFNNNGLNETKVISSKEYSKSVHWFKDSLKGDIYRDTSTIDTATLAKVPDSMIPMILSNDEATRKIAHEALKHI